MLVQKLASFYNQYLLLANGIRFQRMHKLGQTIIYSPFSEGQHVYWPRRHH